MIAYIPISTQASEDFDICSEPEVLTTALRMYQGFLIEKTKAHPGWREANEIESQIVERLINRVDNVVTQKIELLLN